MGIIGFFKKREDWTAKAAFNQAANGKFDLEELQKNNPELYAKLEVAQKAMIDEENADSEHDIPYMESLKKTNPGMYKFMQKQFAQARAKHKDNPEALKVIEKMEKQYVRVK